MEFAFTWISTPQLSGAGAKGRHVGCSCHIFWEAIGILPSLHFSGQRLVHRSLWSTIILPKMYAWVTIIEES